MSLLVTGQGAEQRPSPSSRRQTSLRLGQRTLHPQGYLYKKQLPQDLEQAHLLGTTVKARRAGRIQDFTAPHQYIQLHNDIEQTVTQKEKTMADADRKHAGHTPTLHELWPKVQAVGRIRLLHVNVHGFHPAQNNMEFEYFIQQMAQLQVDIPMAAEVNQPLDNPQYRRHLQQTVRSFDRHAKVNFGHCSTPSSTTGSQMGGLLSYAQGGIAHVVNQMGRDDIGRWTWMQLGDPHLTVIHAYRVGHGTDGIRTVRAMEMRRLARRHHPLAKFPRKAFDHDILKFMKSLRQQNVPVLLIMDANAGWDSTEMQHFLQTSGFVNIFTTMHPDTPPPRTYDRGRLCIDLGFASPDALEFVDECGYLPFYQLGPYDHRGFFLDINYNRLRKPGVTAWQTVSVLTTPSIKRPSEVRRFITTYKDLMNKANVFEKVKKIKERYEKATDTERHYLRIRLDKYDRKWVELALSAIQTTFRTRTGELPWSPTLAKVGAVTRYWKQRVYLFRAHGTLHPRDIMIPQHFDPPSISSEKELFDHYVAAIRTWHSTKGNAAKLRADHLEDLIQKYMELRNLKRETAVRQILHWEQVRNLHTKHSEMMTRSKPNVIKTLIVPKPDSSDPEAMMEITDPDDIQNVILRRNATKLGAAEGSPFTTPPLADILGDHGDTHQADEILNGTYTLPHDDEWMDIQHRPQLESLLTHMQRPCTTDGSPIPDMPWTFGVEEFRDTFSKKREDTGCGPSGITMHFYRMFCEDDELANFHATIIYLPFKFGFTLTRWQHSVHFMLQKISIPLWEKLRIIQLLEGDFNGGLRYLFGRKLMDYASRNKISTDATYGGRSGRSCHDALLRIQFTMEFFRLMAILAAFIDVDAEGCFDRQIRKLIGLMTRRLGADKKITRCQTLTLEGMEHRVRIAQGISDGYLKHSPTSAIHGSGQGSGAGVPNWHGHNETLIAAYSDFHKGYTMKSPDGSKSQNQNVISFVDDNKLIFASDTSNNVSELLKECEDGIATWQILLEFTGGALAAPKCAIQMITHDHRKYSFKHHHPYRGVPGLSTHNPDHGMCKAHDRAKNKMVDIEHLQPHEGRRLLGVRLAADGTNATEYQYRLEQSKSLAGQLANSAATAQDAHMIFTFRYCPAVFYCIPISFFSRAQCDKIQAPFMNALLPKLRLNRHIKRDIIWGPKKYGGLELSHMATEQIARTTQSIIGHVRKQSPTGNTFVLTCEAYQLFLGTASQFFTTSPSDHPHRPIKTMSKVTWLWESLSAVGCHIYMTDMWTPSSEKSHCIMDIIVAEKKRRKGTAKRIPDEHVRLANTCRLWLKALLVSDLTLPDGTLDPTVYHGTHQRETTIKFPNYPRPPQWVWAVWQEVLRNTLIKRRPDANAFNILYNPTPGNTHPIPTQLPPFLQDAPTLRELFDQLPTMYQQILGDIQFPDDDGLALSKAIAAGNLTIYSDGTVLNGCGAHAFTLRTESDHDNEAVTGSAPTNGDPDTISSLRPEHFGFLAGVLVTWVVVKKYQISQGHIHAAVDNMAVVQRMNDGIDPEVGHKQHLATDYDVWKETEQILQSMPITASLRHVKGHQDDLHKKGVSGPLGRDAFWNVRMDALAETARLQTPAPIDSVFTTTKAVFFCDSHAITTKVAAKIRSKYLDAPLAEYIIAKEEWTQETFRLVDWGAFQHCMGKLTIHKRINVAKYVFNWQNTGRQKQHFENSAANVEDRKPEAVNECPLGCGCTEDSQHYLQCRVLRDARIPQRDFSAISKWLQKQSTMPELTAVLMHGMEHWMDTGTAEELWDIAHSPYRDDIINAIAEQNSIGWHNALKGRLSTMWGNIYMAHFEDNADGTPTHVTATWWTGELIRQILYFSLATWQHRNEYLHNKDEENDKIRERMEALTQMASWYDRAHQFPQEDKIHFARTYLDRCNDTTTQIRLWLGKIIDIHKYNLRTTLRGYFTQRQ